MAYSNTAYADRILNQAGDDLITSQIVLDDDAAALVASEHKHQMRKVRTVVDTTVTTKYERSVETGTNTWSWVTVQMLTYESA